MIVLLIQQLRFLDIEFHLSFPYCHDGLRPSMDTELRTWDSTTKMAQSTARLIHRFTSYTTEEFHR